MNHKDLSLFIYEAIEKPQRRRDLLATFAEIIEVPAAAVAVEDRQLRWATFRVTHGMDQETIDSYCHYYASLNPYALRRLQNPGDSYKSNELISEAEFKETELYHGWFKPRGWLHSFGITLDTTETDQIYIHDLGEQPAPPGADRFGLRSSRRISRRQIAVDLHCRVKSEQEKSEPEGPLL